MYTYLYFLLFAALHECAHLLVACHFRFKLEEVKVLPFGLFLSIRDFGLYSPLQEIMVLMAGPLLNAGLVLLLSEIPLLCQLNIFLFVFNMMPVYPLDGSKLLLLVSSYFVDYYQALQCQIKISLLCICVFVVLENNMTRIYMCVYLLMQSIDYCKNYRYIYIQSLIQGCHHEKTKVNRRLVYYRPYTNIYCFNDVFYTQNAMLIYLLKSHNIH